MPSIPEEDDVNGYRENEANRSAATPNHGRRGHRRALPLIVVVLGLILASCTADEGETTTTAETSTSVTEATSSTDTQAPEETDRTGGELVVGLENESEGWLPGFVTLTPSGVQAALTMYDPLVRRTRDGEMKPFLAEAVTPNEDLTAWEVTLRPNIEFHDGTPLDAEALKRIFDEFLTSEDSRFLGDLAEVESVEIVDELTVSYNLVGPNPAFLDTLADQPGWPFSPTAAAAAGEDAVSMPVGTGPYRFVSWQRDGELVVERNENYWIEGQPYLDRITFRPIPDADTRLASLFAGDIDAMQSLTLAALVAAEEAAEERDIVFESEQGNNGDHLVFNTARPPFDDVRVRLGLAHATDQQAVIDVDLAGAEMDIVPKTQYWSINSPWYSESVAGEYPAFDLAVAQSMIDEYVNDPARSDGQAPGTPLSMELRIAGSRTAPVAQLLQSVWGQLGVTVEINTMEAAAFVEDLRAGEFEAVLSRQGNEDDPYTTFSVYYGDPETQDLNFTNWTSPALDDLVAELSTTTDFDLRYPIVEQIGLLLNENVPMLWTGPSTTGVAIGRAGVMNLRDWEFPDGTLGEGMPRSIVTWSQVWLDE